MARTSQWTQIGKHKIELSNLQKVLFPDDGIVKAELIEYYLKAAPTILRHLKGRPLSFVRFPDGIYGQSFYQKNRQDWAPNWIEFIALGEDDKIDYILANDAATLVWLANLACLEMHQMHSRQPRFDRPDYIVFDLDPPEGYAFARVVELAKELRELIEGFGYHTFVKTTGGKGVHLVVPIELRYDFGAGHEAAAQIARMFVDAHPSSTTLHVKKDARAGKVFVDIHRNRTYQTIICPYSVRGRKGAPVSTPVTWEELETVTDPVAFNLHTVAERVIATGDPWETIGAFATELHTHRKMQNAASRPAPATREVAKTSLKPYEKKRKLERTPEPAAEVIASKGNGMVIQRHHASRLHYDLRLEQNGTLKSWALPRGLPPRPGVKRLAVAVEDHPLKYLDFQGTIPKGQYGGGEMWVFVRGTYETTKQKKDDSFYFRTYSRELNAEYRMIHTKGPDWLMERVDAPQVDWLKVPIDFMLAQSADEPVDSPDYLYEVKWDGIRAMFVLEEGKLLIRSRNQRDITACFPELNVPEEAFRGTCGIFDGEIVCLDKGGLPVFIDVVSRLHHTSEGAVERAARKHPAVCYLFDCLYLDGRPIMNDPLRLRREWLLDSVKKGSPYRVSEAVDEGVALYKAAAAAGLEGIVAKERGSPYLPGRRSTQWTKIKTRHTIECVILGYTRGEGDRKATFGSLHVGRYKDGALSYLGRVGTGFDDRLMKAIWQDLQKRKEVRRPFPFRVPDEAGSVWIEAELVCEVKYASQTRDGMLREPVFLRMRPDLDPGQCVSES